MRMMKNSFPRCPSDVWCTPPQITTAGCYQPKASSQRWNKTSIQPTLLNYSGRPARCSVCAYQTHVLWMLLHLNRSLNFRILGILQVKYRGKLDTAWKLSRWKALFWLPQHDLPPEKDRDMMRKLLKKSSKQLWARKWRKRRVKEPWEHVHRDLFNGMVSLVELWSLVFLDASCVCAQSWCI